MQKPKMILLGSLFALVTPALGTEKELPLPTCDRVLNIKAEASVIARIPNLAPENYESTLENFEADEASAARALKLTRDFLDAKVTTSIGLVLHGPAGTGKSHLAVAAARAAATRGMRVLYLTPAGLTTYRRTKNKQISAKGVTSADTRARVELHNVTETWSAARPIGEKLGAVDLLVIDDLNMKSVLPEFANIVTYAHRIEGFKVLVATNLSLDTLLAQVYPTDAVARQRFLDRFRVMFETHEMNGPSRRSPVGWARD